MSCPYCPKVYHAKCWKENFKFDERKVKWMCHECFANRPLNQYNPFDEISFDKHDPNNLDEIDDLQVISNMLNSCEKFSKVKFSHFKNDVIANYNEPISVLFNNIDGNASNFDTFVADISQYQYKFSVIAIAETNIGEHHKSLYQISNYNAEYNQKAIGKKKGSGVGMYIHDRFQYKKLSEFCRCSLNLEAFHTLRVSDGLHFGCFNIDFH